MFGSGQTITLNSDGGPFDVVLRSGDVVVTNSKGNAIEVYHNVDMVPHRDIAAGRAHGIGWAADTLEWVAAKMGL